MSAVSGSPHSARHDTPAAATPLAAPGWPQALVALVLLWGAILWAGRDALASMVGVWSHSETFTHAFTVPPIALWLAWRQRQQLSVLTPHAAPWLLLPMAALVLLWLLGELAAANAATHFALVGLLVLAVPAVCGLAVGRVLAFALGFLFFCVPVGEFMVPQLMGWTADFTVSALRLSGIPVVREGLQFVIPSGYWSVEAACSGIRYLVASAMVGVLFAYLHYRSLTRRLVFVGVSVLVPIVANWVRAYLIVMLGHLSDNQLATGVDHLVYGWVFFGVVIMLMFAIGLRWAEPPEAAAAPAAARRTPRREAAGMPRGAAWATALAGAVLLLGAQAWLHALQSSSTQGGVPHLAAPAPAAGWQVAAEPPAAWRHGWHNPRAELAGHYQRGSARVSLAVAYYEHQERDSKVVSSENRVASSEGAWRAMPPVPHALAWNGRTVQARQVTLRPSHAIPGTLTPQLAVWQIYWINGTLTSSDAWAKVVGAWNRLLGRGDASAVILVAAAMAPDGSHEGLLAAFLQDHLGALEKQLQAARDARPGAGTSGPF